MLRLVAMWCVVVSLYALQRTWQIMQVLPLAAQTGPIDHNGLNNLSKWQLDEPPNVNSTGHLVFETINSLLQHWPNTRMRTGHNIVPGIVPSGTLLYHGTWNQELPAVPGWTAMDPEHSIHFCRNAEGEDGCWHLTLITTRPLKILYFDGSSAAKTYGTMDAQDLVAWGKIRPEWAFNELQRIKDLCAWGKEYGINGFVRMEMAFEVMLCSFTSGVSVVSFLNIAEPRHDTRSQNPCMFEVMNAGSWHNRYPGETRIRLDLSSLVSFYDTDLVPSLVSARFGQERWDHRLQNISKEDIIQVTTRLRETLTRPVRHTSSDIDWMALIRVIVDRYSERLEFTQYLINSTDNANPKSLIDHANKTQTQLRIMLRPYILSSVALPSLSKSTAEGTGTAALNWARPVFRLCATIHIHGLQANVMTDSESLLLNAVRETTREICRVVTSMWSSGVLAGVEQYLGGGDLELDIEATRALMKKWKHELDGLMQWLDWNVWVKCRPACGPEEMCYLTTWPLGFPRPGPPGDHLPPSLPLPPGRQPPHGPPHEMEPADDWERPQPRCVGRIEPYLGM